MVLSNLVVGEGRGWAQLVVWVEAREQVVGAALSAGETRRRRAGGAEAQPAVKLRRFWLSWQSTAAQVWGTRCARNFRAAN
jgi:hypothetical protein